MIGRIVRYTHRKILRPEKEVRLVRGTVYYRDRVRSCTGYVHVSILGIIRDPCRTKSDGCIGHDLVSCTVDDRRIALGLCSRSIVCGIDIVS